MGDDGLATGAAVRKPVPLAGLPPWNPRDVANLAAWFDATDLCSITHVAGSVSQWNDKSGNGYHVSQTVGARQPLLNTLNGRSALMFTRGNNQHLDGVSWVMQSPTVVFVVYQFEAPLVNDYQRVFQSISKDNIRYQKRSGSNGHGRRMHENVAVDSNPSAMTTEPEMATLVYNAASSVMRINGVEIVTGDVGTKTPSSNGLSIGAQTDGSIAFGGTVGELIWYDGLLDTGEIADVETYLKDKWGFP